MSANVTTRTRSWKLPVAGLSARSLVARISMRRVGFGVLGLQFLAFAIFSVYQWHRFALTQDFSAYNQAWVLIAHGHLNPPETAFNLSAFYRDHFVLIMWVLAPFYWVFPHAATLLFIQDLAAIGAEMVAWHWIGEMVNERAFGQAVRKALLATALILLIADPWTYWAISFDFHTYTLGTVFALGGLYALTHQKAGWGYLLVAGTALCGDVVATYLVGVGITLILNRSRRVRWHGVAVLLIPILFLGLYGFVTSHAGVSAATTLHKASHATPLTNVGFLAPYGYILNPGQSLTVTHLAIDFVIHPERWLGPLQSRLSNLYANVAPTGGIGLLTPLGVGVPLLVLAQTFLPVARTFSTDFAQIIPATPFLIIGTMVWLIVIVRRRRSLGLIVASAIAVNAIGWGLVWVPKWPTHWVSVTAPTAAVLRKIESSIPPQNEVVASQGIMGRFSGRSWVYPLLFPGVPIETPVTDIIISPYQGINALTTNQILSRIAYLSANPHARLLLHQDGIWLFAYRHPAHDLSLTFPSAANTVPGWASGTAEGQPLLNGPSEDWTMTSGQTAGYVMDQAYWRLPRGTYQVSVRLEDTGPVNVEVWNATASHLLLRRTMPVTNGIEVQSATFVNAKHYPSHLYRGVGPFALDPNAASPYNAIEVRVWTPGGETVNVYQVWITEVSPHF